MEDIPVIPGLDVASGVERVGGDLNSYFSVLRSFCISSKGKLPEMKADFEKNEIKSLTISYHSLKSALASIGVEKLSRDAAELEQACKSGDNSFVSEKSMDFINAVSELNHKLISYFERIDASNPKQEGNEEFLREKIAVVLEAVRDLDNNLAAEIIDELLGYNFSEEVDGKIKQISEFLACFDQIGAELACTELLG